MTATQARLLAGFLLVLLLAVFVRPVPAQAIPTCADRAVVLRILAQEWGEQVVASGITTGGALLEVAASPGGATWTVLLTRPGGPTCAMAAGEGWRVTPPPKAPIPEKGS